MEQIKIILIATMLLSSVMAYGQEKTNAVTGFVLNQDLEPVVGAQITIAPDEEGDEVTLPTCVTDENGHYLILSNQPISRPIVVTKESYPEYKFWGYNIDSPDSPLALTLHLCNAAVFFAGQLATIFLPTTPDATLGQYYRLDRVEDKHLMFERDIHPKANVPYLIIPDRDFRIEYADVKNADKWVEQSFPEVSFYGFYSPTIYGRLDNEGTYLIDKTPDCEYCFDATHYPYESGARIGGLRALITLKSAGNWTNVDWASHTVTNEWMNILIFHDSEKDSTFSYTPTETPTVFPHSSAFAGIVVNQDCSSISNATIRLKDSNSRTIQETKTDNYGHFLLPIDDKSTLYEVTIAAEGYPEQQQYREGWLPFDFSKGSQVGIFSLHNKVSFKAGQQASIILPTTPDPSVGKFFKLEKIENGKIVFCREPNPKANVPYLIIPDKDFEIDSSISKSSIKTEDVTIPGVSLRGYYQKHAFKRATNEYPILFDKTPDCNYVYESEHSQNEVGCIVGSMRALLVLDELNFKEGDYSIVNHRPNLYDRWIIDKLVELRDEITYTGSIKEWPSIRDETIHDLQGRQYTSPSKSGLYIRGGKKMIIK